VPIDVIKLIVDIYYTPKIDWFESDDKNFYITFTYPSNTITLQISRPDYRFGKGMRKWYITDNIKSFINYLNENKPNELLLINPFNLRITFDKDNIQFVIEHVDIDIKNTELCRKQLIDVMIAFKDYVEMYDDDFI
jgi:hypothetical protein